MALSANQELCDVRTRRFIAADECIERVDAVHQPGLDQKFEGTIDGRRRRLVPFFGEFGEDLVGTDRFMCSPDDFENSPSDRG